MHKWLIFILVFLCTLPLLSAMQFSAPPSTLQSFFAECKNASTGRYYASTANVTIYYPNTSIFKNNIPMTSYATGQFVYIHNVSNRTGVYNGDVVCRATSGGALSSGADSYEVRDREDEILGAFAVAFVLMFFIVLGFIASGIFVNNKDPDPNRRTNRRLVGFILLGLPLVLTWILNFVLMVANVGKPYYNVLRSVFYFTSIMATIALFSSVILIVLLIIYAFPFRKK